jgi:hypothetical protein
MRTAAGLDTEMKVGEVNDAQLAHRPRLGAAWDR